LLLRGRKKKERLAVRSPHSVACKKKEDLPQLRKQAPHSSSNAPRKKRGKGDVDFRRFLRKKEGRLVIWEEKEKWVGRYLGGRLRRKKERRREEGENHSRSNRAAPGHRKKSRRRNHVGLRKQTPREKRTLP